MRRKLPSRRAGGILGVAGLLAPLALPAPAPADDQFWNNAAGGSFQDPADWSPAAVPVAGDGTIFDLSDAGYTVTFANNVNDVGLIVRNDRVTFDLFGGGLGFNAVFVHSDTHPFVLGETVGNDARLTVTRAQNFSTSFATARTLGAAANSSGRLVIGNDSVWTATSNIAHEVNVGLGGSGTVVIQDGGRGSGGLFALGRNAGSSGALTVTGPSSSFTMQTLRVGHEGSGTVLVENGASLGINGSGVIAITAGSTGTVTVSGAGSEITIGTLAGAFSVGGQGDGSLTVAGGGRFTSPVAVTVGVVAGGKGSVLVTGPGSRMSTQALSLASSLTPSATASLSVADGASLSTGPATLSAASGNTANALVTGHSSTWAITTDLFVGHAGDAHLTVADGGVVTAPAQTTFGQLATGMGHGRVTGAGSTLNATGGLTVGNLGSGSLAIDSGGRVNSAGLTVAANAFSRSSIDVSGAGALLNVIGGVSLGPSGAGAITVRGGARATTEELVTIGSAGQGNGTLHVSGPGSSFQASTLSTDGIELAHQGTGAIIVENGATLRTPTLFTAAGSPGARASVTVTGPGSSLSVTSPDTGLYISGDGSPQPVQGGSTTFTVSDRASLTAAGRVSVIRNSTLAITSGATASIEQPGGKLTIFDSSSLLVDNGTLTLGAAGIDNFGETRLANSARIALRPGAQGVLSNSGLLSGDGRVGPRLVNNPTGEVRASAGQRLHFAFPLASSNQGELNLLGGTLEFSALLNNTASGRISGRGTLVAPTLDNEGRIHLSSGLSDFFTTINNTTPASEVIVSGGASATFYSPVNNVPGAEFRVSQNSTATFFAHVTGSNFFSGPGIVNFEAGASAVGALSVGGARVAPLASLDTAGFRTNSLTVEGVARVLANSPLSRTSSLTILEGGSLDLANNDLVIDGGDLAAATAHFAAGRLFSSAATPVTTLAIVKNDDGSGSRLHATFSGESVDASDVLVKYTYFGDANLDGRVGVSDFFAADRGRALRLAGWQNGDFNHSGGVADAADFMLMDRAFLAQGAALSPLAHFPPAAAASPVPEPAALILLLPAVLLLRRRRAGGRAAARAIAVCGAAALMFAGVGAAHAQMVAVLLEGQAAPGLPGTVVGQIGFPSINDSGRLAVDGVLLNGTGGVTAANDGVGWTGTPGALGVIAREGAAAPGLTGITYATVGAWRPITDTGQVAYEASLAGAGVTAANDNSMWLHPPTGTAQLAYREGAAAPGLGGATFGTFSSSASAGNTVALIASLTGTGVTTANDSSIWSGVPGTLQLIGREGNQVPVLPAGNVYGTFNIVDDINKAGHLAFRTTMAGPDVTADNDSAVFVGGPNNNVAIAAREGDAAPGLPSGVVFGAAPTTVRVNDSGLVFLFADLRGTGVDTTNERAFYVGVPGALGLVARKGSQAPGAPAGAMFLMTSTTLGTFNNSGQTSFTTNMKQGSGGVHAGNDSGHWIGGPGNLRLLAREGDPFDAIPGTVLSSVGSFALNDAGQEAFASTLLVGPGGVTATDDNVLWLADATGDGLVVARAGNTLGGRTAASFDRLSINNFGQLGFRAEFTDGSRGVFFFTPEARFRRTSSGTWDDRNNWSVSTQPALVHRVFIDPDASLTVTGPAADLAVRSLQVGGGQGIATLRLQQGAVLSVAEGPVTIAANGVLTGDGAIGGAVTNNGTISFPTNLTVTGGLSNSGVITGSGRINAVISNAAAGQVRVNDGSRLLVAHATGTSVNAGRLDVLSGELEWDGSLTNQGQIGVVDGMLRARRPMTNAATGLISARDSSVFFDAGLTNSGIVGFSFGTSDVWGALTNGSGGKMIISGSAQVTFMSPLTNQAGGELRVSPGATAVFFAPVTNSGAITGGGAKRFELDGSNLGALSSGGSTSVAAPAAITATHIREAALSVAGSVTIPRNGTTLGTSRLGALTIDDGGTFDLTNNDLIIDAGDPAEVTGYVSSGKLTSSSATSVTTLGVVLNGTLFTTFSDQSVDPADVLVKYTYFGDSNLDGRVGISDFFAADRGRALRLAGWQNGDFNHSGGVADAGDFMLMDRAFLAQGAALSALPHFPTPPSAATPVPEPTALTLLLLPVTLLPRRRRHSA